MHVGVTVPRVPVKTGPRCTSRQTEPFAHIRGASARPIGEGLAPRSSALRVPLESPRMGPILPYAKGFGGLSSTHVKVLTDTGYPPRRTLSGCSSQSVWRVPTRKRPALVCS